MPETPLPAPLVTITPAGWKTLPGDLNSNFLYLYNQAQGGGYSAFLRWFFGSGRIVGEDTTAGQILPPLTPSNSFRLPNGKYSINMVEVVVNDPAGYIVIGDLPTVAGTYHVYAGADDEIDELYVDESGFLPAFVYDPLRAYLGTITTTGDEVTAVDASASSYIQSYYWLQQRAGAVGDGSGGTVDLSSVLSRLAELEKRVGSIENNDDGGIVAVPANAELLQTEFQIALTFLVEQHPTLARLLQTAVDVPGSTGNLEPLPDGPARRARAGGNATRSGRTKSIK